jgi:hypothetical protein
MTAAKLKMIDPPVISAEIGQPAVVTDAPKQKTVEELNAELAVLEAELTACIALTNDRNLRSYRVQSATTQHALGTGTLADLQHAQAQLDESVEALLRKSHLEGAIAELRDSIRWVEGQNRRVFCKGIKAEFDATFDDLKQQSQAMLATYKRLQQIASRYQGMTNRDIFPAYLRQMHLPILHGDNDWSGTNQPTGTR